VAPPPSGLALHPRSNSPDHNAKGTQSAVLRSEDPSQPPTACRYMVSGTISLPAQGCFSPFPHGTRSLSVTRESLALEGGPPGFTPGSSFRALLRKSTTYSSLSSTTGLSPSMALHSRRLCLTSLYANVAPTTPASRRTPVWALPLSLAATEGISVDFSFLQVLRCFSSLGSLAFRRDWDRSQSGFPIRPSRDHSLCAAPPGLSQLTTAFIASVCPGIPHIPSLA
jgi:hypothetical protein